ncbi:LacI family DNA-binding transcriptional regulator [Kribbella sp. NPDC051587]|uniref:LacI family DNA-binding transcriptional regulator n=1 Tax=Kribbella sp. NPDC051587 TaxID=3364119 RepID=UPI00379A4C58
MEPHQGRSPLREIDSSGRVTMRQVALAANVSVTTVSHVVNGTRIVADETRQRVQLAMKTLGYDRQPATGSPLTASGRTIGLAMTVANNPYWVDLIQGVEAEAARAGLNLVVVDTRDDARYEAAAVSNLVAHRIIEGLVISPAAGWRSSTLPLVRRQRVPFVAVDRIDPTLHADQVGVENESAAAAVVEHLMHHGHRRIGMLKGIPGLSTSVERLRGFELAHKRNRFPIDPQLIRVGNSSTAGGRTATAELLRLAHRPTALFAANGAMTIGAMTTLQSAGLRVPEDVALVAFDDFPWADLFTPAPTTVAQPSAAIGARAVQLLVRRMEDPDAPPRMMRLPAEIMHRNSCGCALEPARSAVRAPARSPR